MYIYIERDIQCSATITRPILCKISYERYGMSFVSLNSDWYSDSINAVLCDIGIFNRVITHPMIYIYIYMTGNWRIESILTIRISSLQWCDMSCVSNHQQHNCLYNSLSWLAPKKTSKIHIAGTLLTLKHRETHGCVVSTVATDALVLKHQAISIHNAD